MKIKQLLATPYDLTYAHGYKRQGALLRIENEENLYGIGDLAPLPERSHETLSEALVQVNQNKNLLSSINWNKNTFLEQLTELSLVPSLAFAVESALFSLFNPTYSCKLEAAALLMGNSVKQILDIAKARREEGFSTVKLKIGNLTLDEASAVIEGVKDLFKLRIDANSKWTLSDSIRLYSKFPIEAFEYVEDPVTSIEELVQFPYPIAIDEPFAKGKISLNQLESLSNLKALIYKPTVQGGYLVGKQLKTWTDVHGIPLVLSSSLESEVGHLHIAATAARLGLAAPIGIGTYHYLKEYASDRRLHFHEGRLLI